MVNSSKDLEKEGERQQEGRQTINKRQYRLYKYANEKKNLISNDQQGSTAILGPSFSITVSTKMTVWICYICS
jgi:hypothetical protein